MKINNFNNVNLTIFTLDFFLITYLIMCDHEVLFLTFSISAREFVKLIMHTQT
jgi:hypothetical protein